MKLPQLENKANKTKDPKDILKYKKQRNYVVKLNNQSKQENFDRLNSVLDSKLFSKTCKPYFSNKHCFYNSEFALNENGEILPQKIKIAKTFKLYFVLNADSLEPWNYNTNLLQFHA